MTWNNVDNTFQFQQSTWLYLRCACWRNLHNEPWSARDAVWWVPLHTCTDDWRDRSPHSLSPASTCLHDEVRRITWHAVITIHSLDLNQSMNKSSTNAENRRTRHSLVYISPQQAHRRRWSQCPASTWGVQGSRSTGYLRTANTSIKMRKDQSQVLSIDIEFVSV